MTTLETRKITARIVGLSHHAPLVGESAAA